MTTFAHQVPREDLAFGIVKAVGVEVRAAAADLAQALGRVVARRQQDDLDEPAETLRQRCREVLRNGSYKPTGRGKPASEYLVRAAKTGEFPSINGPVDVNNYISLRHLVPVSVWDLERSRANRFEMRLGAPDERYVFNAADQTLELRDLVCGVAVGGEGSSPVVSPIKDSMATKVQSGTTHIGGVIYYPLEVGGAAALETIVAELRDWLGCCGPAVDLSSGLLLPGKELVL